MSDRANRAAQFLPFDSLKGLPEELKRREEKHSRIEKLNLSEEQQNALSAELLKAEKNDIVQAIYFFNGHYTKLKGKLINKNEIYRYVTIGDKKIFFDDLYDFKIIEK